MTLSMPAADDAARAKQVLADVNRAHGTDYVVLSKASGGLNHGAWLIRAGDTGRRAVLEYGLGRRIDHLRRAMGVVARLRGIGYPTPAWVAVGADRHGDGYQIQEHINGAPAGRLTIDTARQLIDVLEQHKGLDPYPERDWSAYVREEFEVAAAALQSLGAAESGLAEHYRRLVAGLGTVELPRDDLVHGDFNTCNVLLDCGRLSGVIDVDALGSGTRTIDYAWLLRETYVDGAADPEILPMLRRAGEAVAGPKVLAYCTAVTALDIVRWLANHAPSGVPRVIPRLHDLADDLARPAG